MGKNFLRALVLAFVLLAFSYLPAKAPGAGIPPSPPLTFELVKDRSPVESPTVLPTPQPSPTPVPVIFGREEVENGQVTVAIPKIGISAVVRVAREEPGQNGETKFDKAGEEPHWISNWGARVGAEGVAWIYGERQWGPVPKIFTDLDKLEAGDQILFSRGEKILVFEVTGTIIIDPEPETFWPTIFSYYVKALEEGKSQVALITCTPWGTAQQRLIVFAQLVP